VNATAGFLERRVAEEFPGLRLDWLSVDAADARSSPSLVAQLRDLSNRYRGATVVTMRTKPIPHAYRSFFRQIGLDPDVTRIPSEAAAVERLMHGGFRPQGSVADALLVALIETGVPIWALDADAIEPAADGGIGIRTARAGERLGSDEYAGYIEPGSLVVADATAPLSMLFGEVVAERSVSQHTRRIMLFAVAVAGVPAIHIEEALWLAVEALNA
jgi:DNA/RNA-binding domain of Phe-tRNA-synthetase-like protein